MERIGHVLLEPLEYIANLLDTAHSRKVVFDVTCERGRKLKRNLLSVQELSECKEKLEIRTSGNGKGVVF